MTNLFAGIRNIVQPANAIPDVDPDVAQRLDEARARRQQVAANIEREENSPQLQQAARRLEEVTGEARYRQQLAERELMKQSGQLPEGSEIRSFYTCPIRVKFSAAGLVVTPVPMIFDVNVVVPNKVWNNDVWQPLLKSITKKAVDDTVNLFIDGILQLHDNEPDYEQKVDAYCARLPALLAANAAQDIASQIAAEKELHNAWTTMEVMAAFKGAFAVVSIGIAATAVGITQGAAAPVGAIAIFRSSLDLAGQIFVLLGNTVHYAKLLNLQAKWLLGEYQDSKPGTGGVIGHEGTKTVLNVAFGAHVLPTINGFKDNVKEFELKNGHVFHQCIGLGDKIADCRAKLAGARIDGDKDVEVLGRSLAKFERGLDEMKGKYNSGLLILADYKKVIDLLSGGHEKVLEAIELFKSTLEHAVNLTLSLAMPPASIEEGLVLAADLSVQVGTAAAAKYAEYKTETEVEPTWAP